MSNCQPCQGQRSIPLSGARRYWPGSRESTRRTILPLHKGAPACGQRLKKAKYWPATLKSAISRPFTVTSLLSPDATSPTAATTCRLMLCQRVELLRIAAEKLLLLRLGELNFEDRMRIVEI